MTTLEIKEQVQSVVLDLLPDSDLEKIADDEDIFSLGLDSINAMSLVMNLQDAFAIQFDPSDISIDNFRTIDDISKLVADK